MFLHLSYVIYGILSLLEAGINFVLYFTFLYKIFPVMDFSMPFHFWFVNKFCKKAYLRNIKP